MHIFVLESIEPTSGSVQVDAATPRADQKSSTDQSG